MRKLDASYTVDSGQEATARLLAAPEPPRAIVYSNDLMALGGLRMAQALGVGRCPPTSP